MCAPLPPTAPRVVEPPPVSPRKAEMARLQAENDALRQRLLAFHPASVTMSPELFSVRNRTVDRIRMAKSVSYPSLLLFCGTVSVGNCADEDCVRVHDRVFCQDVDVCLIDVGMTCVCVCACAGRAPPPPATRCMS